MGQYTTSMLDSINTPISIPITGPATPSNTTEFITTWNTNNAGVSGIDQIALPVTASSTYPFDVVYNGSVIKTVTGVGDNVVTFPDGTGIKTISIDAPIDSWTFNNGGDRLKILDIGQWGNLKVGNAGRYFYGCNNMTVTATDAPDLTGTSQFFRFFAGCSSLVNEDFGNWDVSGIKQAEEMFLSCPNYIGNGLENWDVSGFTAVRFLFRHCGNFNGDIRNWVLASANNWTLLLGNCASFNRDLSAWNTSHVTGVHSIFSGCLAYDGAGVDSWDVSNITVMNNMFLGSGLTTANYDLILSAWNLLILKNNVSFHAGSAQYSAGAPAAARANIISTYAWTITDGGQEIP